LDLFRYMASEGHEQLIVGHDRETGLQALIAIHDTTLGPALGGCRLWAYRTFEDAAMDALRLSKIMTYKAAISGLPFGGGKAVINARPQDKTPALLAAFGRLINSMAGLYITAEDVGMTVADLVLIKQVTRYATGVPEDQGGGGDPSVLTAIGVFHGMRRCLQEALGEDSLKDRTVAVQGLGKVGMQLAHLLHQEGANLIVTDLNRDRVSQAVKAFKAKAVSPMAIYQVPCEIFAPCALGSILNTRTIPKLRCRIVAGAANNQLSEPADGRRLNRRRILYAPDYVINAGGLIHIASELEGYDRAKVEQRTKGIAETLGRVFEYAALKKISPVEAADRMALERIRAARRSTA